MQQYGIQHTEKWVRCRRYGWNNYV